jgi:hypothetical protein
MLQFIMRDVGGDKLHQDLWPGSLSASFCTLFLVSLANYTKREVTATALCSSTAATKFQHTRELLWSLVAHTSEPKIVIIFNKQV